MNKLVSKRLETCFTTVSLILLLLPITLPYAPWNLTLTKKLRKRQNHSFFSNKFISQAFYQVLQTTKNELWKTVRLTSFQNPTTEIRFNLLQVCPSVSTFVFAVLLMPSFNVLSDCFLFYLIMEQFLLLEFWQNSWHSFFNTLAIFLALSEFIFLIVEKCHRWFSLHDLIVTIRNSYQFNAAFLWTRRNHLCSLRIM